MAQARLLRLEAPRENAASFRGSAYAPDATAQVEGSLEEARNAAGALEPRRALEALSHAERVLREHPELPQSAWLMAEILELAADVERTAPDGADAERALRRRAAALEGPRATPFSDRASSPNENSAAESPQPLEIQGLEASDTLEWDGISNSTAFNTLEGEHHARVARNGRLLWAGWVRVEAGPGVTQIRLPVPATVACSPDDVGQGRIASGRALPALHARCDGYVLARARATGGIEAAFCEREKCGAVVIWERSNGKPHSQRDALIAEKRVWPYAVAISAGALALTGLILWRAGVFERREAPSKEVWVYNPKPETLGFRF